MKLASGVKLNTPRMSELLENEYLAQMAEEDRTLLDNDWEHTEPHECSICNGTGLNIALGEPCINCDETGIEYKMVYGVKGGHSYAYTIEYGMEAKKEYCKAMREAFADMQIAGKVGSKSMMMPFALPKTVEMEMLARGYDVKQAQRDGNLKEIANIVAREYPEFLCVPYTNF